MSAIRNSCVARGLMAAGAAGYVYTVPPATVFLLKSVYNRPQGIDNMGLVVYAFAGDNSASAIVQYVLPSTTFVPPWEGWLALNTGDQVYVQAPGDAMWYWISGALLPYIPGQ